LAACGTTLLLLLDTFSLTTYSKINFTKIKVGSQRKAKKYQKRMLKKAIKVAKVKACR
jgi:hypothetical protein